MFIKFVTKYGERPPDIVCAITRLDTLQAGIYIWGIDNLFEM